MKLIHCSIYIGFQNETNLSPKQASKETIICITFSRMLEYAMKHGVTVVLIAGDLFDTERCRKSTLDYVLDTVGSAPEIDFLYLRGNHDEQTMLFQKELPANLKLFSEEWTSYRYGSVVISGIEMNRRNCYELYHSLRLQADDLNIVMLHGQEAASEGEELIALPELKNQSIDYLALGHLHGYKKEKLDYRGSYCYSGFWKLLGFDECGQKGFVLINTDGTRLTSEFVPFAFRNLYEVPVDITGRKTVLELCNSVNEAAEALSSESLVKVVLCGTYLLDTQKNLPFILSRCRERFYFMKITDESRLELHSEDYR